MNTAESSALAINEQAYGPSHPTVATSDPKQTPALAPTPTTASAQTASMRPTPSLSARPWQDPQPNPTAHHCGKLPVPTCPPLAGRLANLARSHRRPRHPPRNTAESELTHPPPRRLLRCVPRRIRFSTELVGRAVGPSRLGGRAGCHQDKPPVGMVRDRPQVDYKTLCAWLGNPSQHTRFRAAGP